MIKFFMFDLASFSSTATHKLSCWSLLRPAQPLLTPKIKLIIKGYRKVGESLKWMQMEGHGSRGKKGGKWGKVLPHWVGVSKTWTQSQLIKTVGRTGVTMALQQEALLMAIFHIVWHKVAAKNVIFLHMPPPMLADHIWDNYGVIRKHPGLNLFVVRVQ